MKEEENRRHSKWFVEPLDSVTNGIVFEFLRDAGLEEQMIIGAMGTDRHCHNVYRFPDHQTIRRLLLEERKKVLVLNIFTQGPYGGRLRPWPFE